MGLRRENFKMVGKLAVITLGMFGFGFALVPIYDVMWEWTKWSNLGKCSLDKLAKALGFTSSKVLSTIQS